MPLSIMRPRSPSFSAEQPLFGEKRVFYSPNNPQKTESSPRLPQSERVNRSSFYDTKNIASIDNRVSINRPLDPSSPCQRPKRSTRPARSSPSTGIETGKTKQKRHNLHTVYILIPRFTDVLARFLDAFSRFLDAFPRFLDAFPPSLDRSRFHQAPIPQVQDKPYKAIC